MKIKITIALVLCFLLLASSDAKAYSQKIDFSPSLNKIGVNEIEEIIKNVNFTSGLCSEVRTIKIPSEESLSYGTWKYSNRDYFEGVRMSIGKRFGKWASVRSFSSQGPLNFSLEFNKSFGYSVYFTPFNLKFPENGDAFFGVDIENIKCLTAQQNWSLIRIPIAEVSVNKLINYTININRRLGYNKDVYIFLLGLPLNSGDPDFSDITLISEDPILINFKSKSRKVYPDANASVLNAFIDIYYIPIPSLKIRQRDIVDLEKTKLSREAYAQNLYKKSIFYNTKNNYTNFFCSDKDLVDGIEITSSRGEKLFLDEDNIEIQLIKTPCFYFSDKKILFPFQCININSTLEITNYLTSFEDTLPVDFQYTLGYNEPQYLKIEESSRCISYNQFSTPPIQVIKDIQQPPFTFQLNSMSSSCVNNRFTIIHEDIAQYISPELLSYKDDFLKNENLFKSINFAIMIPKASMLIRFNAKLKNYLLPKLIFFIILFGFTLLMFVNIYSISKKIRRNAQNKSKRNFGIFSLIITQV